jgi:hypothetical protein
MNLIGSLDVSIIRGKDCTRTIKEKYKKLSENYPDLTAEFEYDEVGISKINFFTEFVFCTLTSSQILSKYKITGSVTKVVDIDTKNEKNSRQPLLIYLGHVCMFCEKLFKNYVVDPKLPKASCVDCHTKYKDYTLKFSKETPWFYRKSYSWNTT